MTAKYNEPELQKLHDLYQRLSGRVITWTCTRRFAWEAFVYRGFAITDLELVLRYICRMIEQHKRRPESLRFERVVVDLDHFEDDLAEAKAAWSLAEKRKGEQRAPRAKVAVLEATGRLEEIPDKVTTPAQVLNVPVAELVAAMRKAL